MEVKSTAVEFDEDNRRMPRNRSTLFVKEFVINRRQFISAAAAASTASLWAQQRNEWGGPVLASHLHLRPDGESHLSHINGSGVTKAVLRTRVQSVDQSR